MPLPAVIMLFIGAYLIVGFLIAIIIAPTATEKEWSDEMAVAVIALYPLFALALVVVWTYRIGRMALKGTREVFQKI